MRGVIAAGHPDTAAAGAEILQQGGNGVDAGVAACFASFIAESVLVNIGGGGIAHLYNPTSGQSTVYDFFSTMPGLGAPTNTMAMDFRQILVDFGSAQQPFYIGRGSCAVPGVVAGLCQLQQVEGTLPLATILQPAIRLAQQGSQLSPSHGFIAHLLAPILTDTPAIAKIYAPNHRLVQAGDTLTFPQLAHTLEQLGQEGVDLFYRYAIARQIVADQQTHGGLITAADLTAYEVYRLKAIEIPYRGYTILLPPPSSIGGVLIAFTLKLLAHFPLPTLPYHGLQHLCLLIEAMRLTNISRAEWYQQAEDRSPLALRPILDNFLGEENISRYANTLRRMLTDQIILTEPSLPSGPNNTTHLSVADANGMLVSITTSAGENAGFTIGETGVSLNNMLGEIDLHPEGFHRLSPGQRLTTMMSPVIVLKDNQPVLAMGSGGSNRIRSAILQLLSNIIDFNMPLQAAIDAPRLHFEDDLAQLEGGINPTVVANLEAQGYKANLWPERNMFFGGTHAVAYINQQWQAAGDARRGGSTIVVS